MNRCPYCGHRCYGRTCTYHADLPKIDPVTAQYHLALVRREEKAV